MTKRKRGEETPTRMRFTVNQARTSPVRLPTRSKRASHIVKAQKRRCDSTDGEFDEASTSSNQASAIDGEREPRVEKSVFAVMHSYVDSTGSSDGPEFKGLYRKVWDANKAAAKVVHQKLLEKKLYSDMVFFDISSRDSRYLIPADTLSLNRNVAISILSGCGGIEYKVRMKSEGLTKVWVEERKLRECSTDSDDEFSDSDLPYLKADEFIDWYLDV